MRIYEIDQAIFNCVDEETGEVIDSERLDALQMERDTKIDNLACWYKQLIAEAEAIKAEEKTLAERRKQKENQAGRLKNYLSDVLAGQKLETPRNKITWRKSESVNIVDETVIGSGYKEEIVSYKIDKASIKNALKCGIKVIGAELETHNNIQIN